MKIRWKNSIYCPFILTVLGGCASNPVIIGPDGTPHQLISCAQVRVCYRQATEVCGGKYQIINTSNNVNSGLSGTTTSTIDMLIKCQPPE